MNRTAKKDAHFFNHDTPGWDEAWNALARHMDKLLIERGIPTAYQALQRYLAKSTSNIPDRTSTKLMQIVLNGFPGNIDRCRMESELFPTEIWMYDGTFTDKITGRWEHHFRHRFLDLIGDRCIVRFPCNTPIPDNIPEPQPTAIIAYKDNKQPF